MLAQLSQGIRQELGGNLVGIYPRGSLAYGDFDPETSDLDLLVVTEHPVEDVVFTELAAFHRRLARSVNPFATRLEIAYVDRKALWTFSFGQRHPTLEQGAGETLKWQEHGANWILERWAVRTHSTPLHGPDPRTLIAPVYAGEIVAAVCTRLRDWADWARDVDDPDWQLPRSHKAYVVETMCRALYTLYTGELASKPRSVAWALHTLPEPWRELAARSQTWRQDETVDLTLNSDIRRFVLWVAASDRCAALYD